MALAYALHHIESKNLAQAHELRRVSGELLRRRTRSRSTRTRAWSCAHGVGRWSSNCGCNSGGHGRWNQEWRGPLREALDWLRDSCRHASKRSCGTTARDPWEARNEYIHVVLDRSPETRDEFLAPACGARVDAMTKQVEIWKLLEMQRHAMLMYTSCGWFFDEISGIETVQVIQYAGAGRAARRGTIRRPFGPHFWSTCERPRATSRNTKMANRST